MGPIAQDFAQAFGLGENSAHINTVDAVGVTMAAVQGLRQVVRESDARITANAAEIERLRAENELLAERIAALEAVVHSRRSP